MITLTNEQQQIVDFLWEQVRSPNGQNVVVSGSGGTGKTTMVCEFITQLLAEGYSVAVTAMTGKATSVLRGKIWTTIREKELNFEKDKLLIDTVTKITKKSSLIGTSSDGSSKFSNTWKNPALFKYDVLIIDELSMIPQYISQWWQMTDARVFGFGDECQLPEVATPEVKKDLNSFRNDLHVSTIHYVSGYGVKVLKNMALCQLHKVLRSDNDIALLCGELRDFSLTKREMVLKIRKWAEKSPDIEYYTSKKDLKTSEDWQIICYTNKLCQEINDKLCIGGAAYPDLADKVLLFDNINPLGLYNGDVITFAKLMDSVLKARLRKRPVYICVKWKGKMPSRNGNEFERAFFAQYQAYLSAMESASEQRWWAAKNTIKTLGLGGDQVDQYLKDMDTFLAGHKTREDALVAFVDKMEGIDRDTAQAIVASIPPTPRLYFVTIDYGYAITTHKSQGSEYENVCYVLERFDKPLVYTGLSRAKKKLAVIDLTANK